MHSDCTLHTHSCLCVSCVSGWLYQTRSGPSSTEHQHHQRQVTFINTKNTTSPGVLLLVFISPSLLGGDSGPRWWKITETHTPLQNRENWLLLKNGLFQIMVKNKYGMHPKTHFKFTISGDYLVGLPFNVAVWKHSGENLVHYGYHTVHWDKIYPNDVV